MPTITPEIGMGATVYSGSDRYAVTVVAVKNGGRTIHLQKDTARRTDKNGMSESQTWEFERDPDGEIMIASLRKDGSYRRRFAGDRASPQDPVVRLGVRRRFIDFTF